MWLCNTIHIYCAGIDCGNDSTLGPHTRTCLQIFWTEAGCLMTGTNAPITASRNVDWWNERTVEVVKFDMQLYHTYALQNTNNYRELCFGPEQS